MLNAMFEMGRGGGGGKVALKVRGKPERTHHIQKEANTNIKN